MTKDKIMSKIQMQKKKKLNISERDRICGAVTDKVYSDVLDLAKKKLDEYIEKEISPRVFGYAKLDLKTINRLQSLNLLRTTNYIRFYALKPDPKLEKSDIVGDFSYEMKIPVVSPTGTGTIRISLLPQEKKDRVPQYRNDCLIQIPKSISKVAGALFYEYQRLCNEQTAFGLKVSKVLSSCASVEKVLERMPELSEIIEPINPPDQLATGTYGKALIPFETINEIRKALRFAFGGETK